MSDDGTRVPIDGALARGQLLEAGSPLGPTYRRCACEGPSGKVEGFIAVIENRKFLRECIRRSMQPAFSIRIVAHSTVLELERQPRPASPELVILSLMEANHEAIASALKILSEIVPGTPVIVLTDVNDVDLARTAACYGAKGYIPVTMGFEIAVEAVRFVLAGGTCVPMDCFVGRPSVETQPCQPPGALTARELAVIRAIQQGKSNKVIAYNLNMCESTVKVHVRNVMKKLKARNRTEVAIKAQISLPGSLTKPCDRSLVTRTS